MNNSEDQIGLLHFDQAVDRLITGCRSRRWNSKHDYLGRAYYIKSVGGVRLVWQAVKRYRATAKAIRGAEGTSGDQCRRLRLDATNGYV